MKTPHLASGDRSVDSYHFARGFETWYGIVLQVPAAKAESVKKDLDVILSEAEHDPAIRQGNLVYASGAYESETIKEFRQYARENNYVFRLVKPNNRRTSYFEFVGDWLATR